MAVWRRKKIFLSGKNGLKGQKDLSPGQRPGKKEKLQERPTGAKELDFNLLPLWGVIWALNITPSALPWDDVSLALQAVFNP